MAALAAHLHPDLVVTPAGVAAGPLSRDLEETPAIFLDVVSLLLSDLYDLYWEVTV